MLVEFPLMAARDDASGAVGLGEISRGDEEVDLCFWAFLTQHPEDWIRAQISVQSLWFLARPNMDC